MDRCVLLTSTPSCAVSPRDGTTHSGVDVNNTHLSMINPLNHTRFSCRYDINKHDDVIKWKHFPRYWPFVRGINPFRTLSEASVWLTHVVDCCSRTPSSPLSRYIMGNEQRFDIVIVIVKLYYRYQVLNRLQRTDNVIYLMRTYFLNGFSRLPLEPKY